MSTKIEARRCSEKAEAQPFESGQRYGVAVKAVFADLGRCSEHDKTKNFDSNLTATELFDKSSGEDRGGSLDTSKKRRSRDQWCQWPGQL